MLKSGLAAGEVLPEVRLHYRTLGAPRKNADGRVTNAVLIGHGTGGTGAQFTSRNFAGQLFGPGQPLDATQFFIVLPDNVGHGGSSKPSDGLRATFPRYGYLDMVDLQHRLLVDGLGVNHARLIMGTSMGGMHTWLWGQQYPRFMDALMPLADADRVMESYIANYVKSNDANDVLYWFESSRDYDPGPGLERPYRRSRHTYPRRGVDGAPGATAEGLSPGVWVAKDCDRG